MKKMNIEIDTIEFAQKKFDFFLSLPINEIENGISYLEEIVFRENETMKKFMEYFRNTWITKYEPGVWNMTNKDVSKLVARSNNPIERYNRRLNDKFAASHSNINNFIEVIRAEENDYSSTMRGIRTGKIPRQKEPSGFSMPIIPQEYFQYKKMNK